MPYSVAVLTDMGKVLIFRFIVHGCHANTTTVSKSEPVLAIFGNYSASVADVRLRIYAALMVK